MTAAEILKTSGRLNVSSEIYTKAIMEYADKNTISMASDVNHYLLGKNIISQPMFSAAASALAHAFLNLN